MTTVTLRVPDYEPIELDYDALVTEVRRLAADNPEKVAACAYVAFDDKDYMIGAECIMGCALHNLGVPLDLLVDVSSESINNITDMADDDWLARVQRLQDGWKQPGKLDSDENLPWADAVKAADEGLGTLTVMS